MQIILFVSLIAVSLSNVLVKEYLKAVAKFGVDKMVLESGAAGSGNYGGGNYGAGNYASGSLNSDRYSSGLIASKLANKDNFLSFQKFKKDVDYINKNENIPFSAAVNQFSILTDSERLMYAGLNFSKIADDFNAFESDHAQQELYMGAGIIPLGSPQTSNLPESIDWEKLGTQSDIRYQGQCGSCWAFSIISAIETSYYQITGDRIAFSEQELIDCLYENDTEQEGCSGGIPSLALKYIKNKDRIAYREDTGYHKQDRECIYDNVPNALTKAKVVGLKRFKSDDELKEGVSIGSVVAYILANELLYMYESGIFEDPNNCTPTPNHVVNVIGYGNIGSRNFWKIRNSWGKRWGEKGYAKISRDTPSHCHKLSTYSMLPLLECREFETCTPPSYHQSHRSTTPPSDCKNKWRDKFCERKVKKCDDLGKRRGKVTHQMVTKNCKKTCQLCVK